MKLTKEQILIDIIKHEIELQTELYDNTSRPSFLYAVALLNLILNEYERALTKSEANITEK